MQKIKLGIDIGGVIIDRANDWTPTSFFEKDYLTAKASPDAFEVIAQLDGAFYDEVHLVSKCKPHIQPRTLEWLAYHNFYFLTGMPEENLHFCLKREEKRAICQTLGITHFVDDRLEVLSYLDGVVPNLFLFSPQEKEMGPYKDFLPRVIVTHNWRDCQQKLLATK